MFEKAKAMKRLANLHKELCKDCHRIAVMESVKRSRGGLSKEDTQKVGNGLVDKVCPTCKENLTKAMAEITETLGVVPK